MPVAEDSASGPRLPRNTYRRHDSADREWGLCGEHHPRVCWQWGHANHSADALLLRLSLAVCGSRTSGGSGQSISSDPSTVLLSDTLRRHGHELVGVARHSIGVKDSLPSSAALAACVSRSHLPRHNFSARSREKDCAQNNRRA